MNYFEWPCDLFFSECTFVALLGISVSTIVLTGTIGFVCFVIKGW